MAQTRRTFLTLTTAAIALSTVPAHAQEDAVFTTLFGGAIRGYDPVAYFTQGRPVEGSGDYQTDWNGARWSFASAEHKALFDADPEAYAPQYGGYCSWAVAQGYTASVDPEAWRIVDGKLYLNYSADIQQRWESDIEGFISSANSNWPSVLE